ncbi:nucleoside-diphosphate-sugar epimerase [Chitinivorax tropicus]|uniref:Nucleoside-diphosphate-sugar epimerase n=1 Tax=Chitinivorax tropicus TaxID=714531 RepID=A0A840MMW7_9PROT|nr:NAD-dependent epimerase/dehydratase family protein [Chitinivorax tropicus]MBB5018082.1 nucleoside-diphosphate-sugar epimerase [Chitinivorax tropicus]
MNALITGARGFVAIALGKKLDEVGFKVIRSTRANARAGEIAVGEMDATTDWSQVLSRDIAIVIHTAAKVPDSSGQAESQAAYHLANTLGTLNLARQCAASGVKRFIFLSSIKVLGEGRDQPYCADDLADPTDAYAISKWKAEQGLMQIAAETDMEVVILRPPLVYGPGVKGNFLRLLQTVERRLPLPFGTICNRRSLIYVGNLIHAIQICMTHPAAAGKTYLLSDGDDVSTPELIRRISTAMGHSAHLMPIPVQWMKWAGSLLGKRAAVDRLIGSLAVDIAPIQRELGWSPPFSMAEGLAATAEWYRQREGKY